LAATLYSIYDRDGYIDRISRLLDDLEARQNRGVSGGPAFRPKLEAAE
jgi:hypothetical protein